MQNMYDKVCSQHETIVTGLEKQFYIIFFSLYLKLYEM
jgi:hypothetical protein